MNRTFQVAKTCLGFVFGHNILKNVLTIYSFLFIAWQFYCPDSPFPFKLTSNGIESVDIIYACKPATQPNSTINVEDICLKNSQPTFEAKLDPSKLPLVHSKPKAIRANEPKRDFIKNMTREAWKSFVSHTWSDKPVDISNVEPKERTIASALSTLWIMDLKDEFNFAKGWMKNFDFSQIDDIVDVGEVSANYIGGLLSCFALSKDDMFLNKAKDIAQVLKISYESETGMPYQFINPKHNSFGHSSPFLSSLANQQLEYTYLSGLIEDYDILTDKVENLEKFLVNSKNKDGLFPMYKPIRFPNQYDIGHEYPHLFDETKVFYFNLIKLYIQNPKLKKSKLELYSQTVDAIERNGLIAISRENSLYFARALNPKSNQPDNFMKVSGCYLGAMLGLGANALQKALDNIDPLLIGDSRKRKENYRIARHWQLAEELTETCHQASVKTLTGLPPGVFYFNDKENATNSKYSGDPKGDGFTFSHDIAESYFVLWRLTHDQKYRDYAWELAQAIYRYCRTASGGYSPVRTVNDVSMYLSKLSNTEQFPSAIFKYLYLTFADDSVLPLDEWLFNSEGHPLPICGTNDAYPSEKCNNRN